MIKYFVLRKFRVTCSSVEMLKGYMLICRNIEGAHCQRKVGNPCAKLNEHVGRLRVIVQRFESGQMKSACLLQVVNLRRAHFNSVNLLERLRMVVTVHQTQPTIQLLLSSNEYAGSLDLIRTTQEVLHQELAGLHCFRSVLHVWVLLAVETFWSFVRSGLKTFCHLSFSSIF